MIFLQLLEPPGRWLSIVLQLAGELHQWYSRQSKKITNGSLRGAPSGLLTSSFAPFGRSDRVTQVKLTCAMNACTMHLYMRRHICYRPMDKQILGVGCDLPHPILFIMYQQKKAQRFFSQYSIPHLPKAKLVLPHIFKDKKVKRLCFNKRVGKAHINISIRCSQKRKIPSPYSLPKPACLYLLIVSSTADTTGFAEHHNDVERRVSQYI